MQRFFQLRERGSDLKTEVLAGVATFMTMAYIIFVNPGILSAAGVPFEGATTATAFGAAIMCITMGLVANRPLAMASGMGLNAMLAFSVIGFQQAHLPWQVGMSIIFIEGVIILILVLTGLREAVMNAIPLDLKRAIGVGIGLFITLIGLNQGGVIGSAPMTLVTLGDFSRPYVWVSLVGLFAILAFRALRVRGEILWGIGSAAAMAIALGVAQWPEGDLVETPHFDTFFAIFGSSDRGWYLAQALMPSLAMTIFAILLTDFFDTMGTVVAIGEQAGFVSEDGKVPGLKQILLVDSAAAAVGGAVGASSITTYIESAAGVAEGGRTGLTSVVSGVLFAVAALFTPIVKMVGGGYAIPNAEHYAAWAEAGFNVPAGEYLLYPITSGALIFVGYLMMRSVREIRWGSMEQAFPAFLTIVGIPLTYNISYGIGFGFISFTVIKLLHAKAREVHPLMYAVSVAFTITFLMPLVQSWLVGR